MDVDLLGVLFSQFVWDSVFTRCLSTDDFADQFDSVLQDAILRSTKTIYCLRRTRLPKHIVSLLRAKKRAWRNKKKTDHYKKYYVLRKTTRAVIRKFKHNRESRLVYAANQKEFFTHINTKLGQQCRDIQIQINSSYANNYVAAEAFSKQFVGNFNEKTQPVLKNVPKHDATLASFNCNESDILVALKSCPCSNTSIDGILCKALTAVAGYIIYPLNVIFQHSFHDGVFLSVWEKAVITPLYKGKGDRSALDSYRPISICSCLGKILERLACSQLTAFLSVNQVIEGSQRGFISRRSCLTNLLEFDQHIVKAIIDKPPYDIVCFDFKKAFDKVPNSRILQAVSVTGICDNALAFLAGFLEGRLQVVRVGTFIPAQPWSLLVLCREVVLARPLHTGDRQFATVSPIS